MQRTPWNRMKLCRSNATASSLIVCALALLTALCAASPASGQDARSMQQPQQPGEHDEKPDGEQEPKYVYVRMTTSKGDIILELNREQAPITVENFMRYVDEKFYDDTIFHRVVRGFMIQGGGFTKDMQRKQTHEPIRNEWQNDLKNVKGTIAMARLGSKTPDPEMVNSATCQFFINTTDNPMLDQAMPDGGGYAVFGKVYAGMNTVEQIEQVDVQPSPLNGERSFPAETVVIKEVRKITEEQAQKAREAMSKPAETKPAETKPDENKPETPGDGG